MLSSATQIGGGATFAASVNDAGHRSQTHLEGCSTFSRREEVIILPFPLSSQPTVRDKADMVQGGSLFYLGAVDQQTLCLSEVVQSQVTTEDEEIKIG